MIRIIAERIEKKAKLYLRKDMDSEEELGQEMQLRVITERCIERYQTVYASFVDNEKTFDRIYLKKMMEIYQNIGVD